MHFTTIFTSYSLQIDIIQCVFQFPFEQKSQKKQQKQAPFKKIYKQFAIIHAVARVILLHTHFHIIIQWRKKNHSVQTPSTNQPPTIGNSGCKPLWTNSNYSLPECFNWRRFEKRIHFYFDANGHFFCMVYMHIWYRGVSYAYFSLIRTLDVLMSVY